MTLQHVVLFRFPERLNPQDERQMRSIIERWPELIGTMSKLRFGTDVAAVGDRTLGFQYLLMMEFASIETFLAYRDHEAHRALSAFIKPRLCEVLAFDYDLTPSTQMLAE